MNHPQLNVHESAGGSPLETMLREDARRLEPPRGGPTAGQIWWKSQILKRLAGEEAKAEETVLRRAATWPFLIGTALFLFLVSTAILMLIPEAEGPALAIYGLLTLLPLGVACGLALVIALGDP